jgi:hypothetical protein
LTSRPAIGGDGTDAKFTYIQHHQRPVRVVPQSETFEQGDVLVTACPVACSYWQSDEDLWDPTFTSIADDFNLAQTSRWQKFWRQVHSIWDSIAKYLMESI